MEQAQRRRLAYGFMLAAMGTVLALIGTGYAMPGERNIVRTRTIAASPAKIHAELIDLETWPKWSAWSVERDPSATWTFSGTSGDIGHTWDWNGKQLGDGKLVLTRVDQNDGGIAYDLTFADTPPSVGAITLVEGEGGTLVTWTNGLDIGNHPFMRLIGPFVESMVGNDFEIGLEGLAKAVE